MELIKINEISKDITTITTGVIGHGVNCQLAMGKGVALAIRKKWPKVYKEYINNNIPGNNLLGTIQIVEISPELYIVNMFTQESYGNSGKFANIPAIQSCVETLLDFATIKNLPVYLPKIGTGLGGLDWDTEVLPAIERALPYDNQITICTI